MRISLKRFLAGFALAALVCVPSLPAAAGPAGFDLSGAVGAWVISPGGDIEGVDMDSTIGLERSTNPMFWLRLEHPLPIVPDFKIDYAPIKFDGGRNNSEFDLKLVDLTAYWHVPLVQRLTADVVDITFGAGARIYDAEFSMRFLGRNMSDDAQKTLPLLYAGGRIRPVDFIALVGEVRGFNYDNDQTMDALLKVEVFPFGDYLFLGAGYRYITLKNGEGGRFNNNDDLDLDIKQGGFFMEVGFDI